MKRIAFDLRCLPADGSPGAGIAHAARELFCACVEQAPAFGIECVGYVVGHAHVSGSSMVRRLASSKTRRWGAGSNRRSLWSAIQEDRCDALFAPTGSVSLGCPVPSFVWVHDVEIFFHPEWFPQGRFQRYFTTHVFLQSLKRAQHVFCVSEDTKKKILKLVPDLTSRLSVTSEGAHLAGIIRPYEERYDQALIFGTVEPRKNIPFIVELWPEVCRRVGKSIDLVIAGNDGWGKVEIPPQTNIFRLRRVSDGERDALLSTARLVLVPSWHEGFGRVSLEAMTHGTPVVVSDRGAHSEVVGEEGLCLDPINREAWIEAIVRLWMDRSDWRQRQEAGLVRARLFPWDRVAERILAVMAKTC